MILRTVLRAASAWFIWRWLEPRWRSTLALIAGWLLVIVLHGEYVEYVRITEQTELLWLSYVAKWVIVMAGIGAYVWFSLLAPSGKTTPTSARPDSIETKLTPQHGDDGFDFLRHKGRLEGRGDQMLHGDSSVSVSDTDARQG